MNYKEAMNYITNVGNFGSNYGLERTFRLLELLGDPQNELKFIHVAGTNGKGSTTSMISKILMEGGYKVGMYTSPFLEEFEERIQINNNNIAKKELASLITEIKVVVDKVIEEGYNHPTEFEIITVLMFLYFKRERVDFGVVEVGLGGRLDSTNVINPLLSVIMSISKDHEGILGNTLTEIAKEKAGIIKAGVPVVMYPQKDEVLNVIKERCSETKSELIVIDENSCKLVDINKSELYSVISTKFENEEVKFNLSLLGDHQVLNASVAIKVIESLNQRTVTSISKDCIESALRSVTWMGRFEVISKNPLVIIDGAHNPQGIEMLCHNLRKYFDFNDMYLIMGVLKDKDVEDMLSNISSMAKEIVTLTPNSPRALSSDELRNKIIQYNSNCNAGQNYKKAYNDVYNKANEDDLILVCGSLYMIGDFRKQIRKRF